MKPLVNLTDQELLELIKRSCAGSQESIRAVAELLRRVSEMKSRLVKGSLEARVAKLEAEVKKLHYGLDVQDDRTWMD